MRSNIHKLKSNITSLKRSSITINSLFEELDSKGDYMLIGGAARDIIYDRTPRDYDIVVDTEQELSFNIPNIKRNRFGGFKININGIEFDIWSLKDTWAIKSRQLEPTKETLRNSCFFNVDSIIYDISNDELIWDHFYEGLEDKILDIVYEVNPYPTVCVVRSLILQIKWDLDISHQLRDYIFNWYESMENPIEKLYDAQIKHYKRVVLNRSEIDGRLRNIFKT